MPCTSAVTISEVSRRNFADRPLASIDNSTLEDPSPNSRSTSVRVFAGTITPTSVSTEVPSFPVSTARRNPSAAASVNESSASSTFTPVRTGRESSVAAANTTRSSAPRNVSAGIVTDAPPSTVGIGGNSSAAIPLIVPLNLSQVTITPIGSFWKSIFTVCPGSEFTKSVSILAGIVMLPSPSICAPIHVLMDISVFVAVSLS